MAIVVAVGLIGAVLVTTRVSADVVPIRCGSVVPSVGGGSSHSLFLDGTGNLRAAGENYFGQVGDDTRTDRATAVPVPGLSGLTSVASSPSSNHSLALKSDGTVWAWGINWHGQLGNGEFHPDVAQPSTPAKVPGVSDIVSISAGGDHSMALTESGTVWAWGRNDQGQLGNGSTSDSAVPVQVSGLTDVVAVSAGSFHSLAVKANGEVFSWGENTDGQLGLGTADYLPHVTPTRVPGLVNVSTVAAGGRHSLALADNGTIYGWGYNDVGAVGAGFTSGQLYSPTPVTGLSSVSAVAAGYWHSLALKHDGTVWAWGYSTRGQLGNGNYGGWTGTPTQVSGISGARAVAAPGSMTIVVRNDGSVHALGDNEHGQLATGDVTDHASPVRTGVTQATPAAPTKVGAVAGEKVALVSWEAPASAVTQYVVKPYRNGVAQAPVATKLPKLEYAVPNLVHGDTYRFEVLAQNCVGDGAASSLSNAVVPVDVQTDETGFSIEGWELNDRHNARVNVSNGNLKVSATDVSIEGAGMPLVVSRSYNGRATGVSSAFGKSWASTMGTDVRLEPLANGSVLFHGPGGAKLGFAKTDSGFSSPAGINSTLTQDATTGAYTLKNDLSSDHLEFSAAGRLLRNVDNSGNAHSYTYGADGRLTKVTDTQARDLVLTYDSLGRIETMQDTTSRVWRYQYDATGNLVAYTDPAGGVTRYAYDANGKLTRLETPGDATGPRIVEFAYDASGRLVKLTYPQQPAPATSCSGNLPRSTTCFDYQPKKTIVTDANGNPTTYHVDAVGRTTQVVDALGNTTSTSYTSNSNVKQRSIGSSTTTFSYSTGNAPTAMSLGTGSGYTLEYGNAAQPFRPSKVTDPQGNATVIAYDNRGNVTSQRNELPAENEVTLEHSVRGLPTGTTDTRGNVTTMDYDAKGNLTRLNPPAPLGASHVTYDALSRADIIVDGNAQQADFDYDALDRVVKTTYADGSTVAYEYDGDGNPVKMTDALGVVTTTYDERNNPTSRTTADGVTVTYTYDGVGNLASVTDPAGTVRYSYNAANLLSSVTEPDADAVVVSYDKDYNRNSVRFPNGVSIFSTYDAAKRLTKVSSVDAHLSPLMSFEYGYKHPDTGRDTSLRQSVKDKDGNVTAYSYDVLNRLVRARTTASDSSLLAEYAYAYDGAGNRTRQTVFDGTQTTETNYAHNGANQLVSVDPLTTLTYDGNGNFRSSTTGAESTYNALDQTASMRATGGLPVEMRYHGQGQVDRMSLGGGAGVPLVSFTNTVLGVSQERIASGVQRSYIRDDTGQVLAQVTATGTAYVLTDGLGSTTGLVDEGGALTGTFEYAPFGETRKVTGTADVMPFRFIGAYLDPTGLYKTGERYYDPSLGRFTQQDPVHDPLDPKQWNRYVYVGGDPVNFADPSGLTWWNPSTWTAEGSREWLSCMARQYVGLASPIPNAAVGVIMGSNMIMGLGLATMDYATPKFTKSGLLMMGYSRILMNTGRFMKYAGVAGILVGAAMQFSPCLLS